MTLLRRIEHHEPHETCATFDAAATERYWDGWVLAVDDRKRALGAIYIMGYTAEIVLKSAYFRFLGVGRHVSLSHRNGPMRALQASAALQGRTLHNLSGLSEALLLARMRRNDPLEPRLAGQLRHNVQVIEGHWSHHLRYKSLPVLDSELEEAVESVDWLYRNRFNL